MAVKLNELYTYKLHVLFIFLRYESNVSQKLETAGTICAGIEFGTVCCKSKYDMMATTNSNSCVTGWLVNNDCYPPSIRWFHQNPFCQLLDCPIFMKLLIGGQDTTQYCLRTIDQLSGRCYTSAYTYNIVHSTPKQLPESDFFVSSLTLSRDIRLSLPVGFPETKHVVHLFEWLSCQFKLQVACITTQHR